LNVHSETEHVPTAEQNFFRSFKKCAGVYTWVLGVDDFPVFDNLLKVLQALELETLDFALFNTAVFDHRLTFSSLNVTELDQERIDRDIVDLACELGIWFVMAGVSAQILKTKLVENYDLERLIKRTSPIYSHVTAYLETFRGRSSAIFNFPLVHTASP
jgi:hypothetical protein